MLAAIAHAKACKIARDAGDFAPPVAYAPAGENKNLKSRKRLLIQKPVGPHPTLKTACQIKTVAVPPFDGESNA